MKNEKLFPVALLHVGGTGIRGSTRMQKLVFLAQEENRVPKEFDYEPGPFGPYSFELNEALKSLIDKGVIDKNTKANEVGNETHFYTLTPTGVQVAQRMAEHDMLETYLQVASELKSKYEDWSIDRLVRFVYRTYPIYTTETELDLQRLHDASARSQFLEPGVVHGESKYLGLGPKAAINNRKSPAEFFSTN